MPRQFPHMLTVDVEEWFHASLLRLDARRWSEFESRVEGNTERLLDLFKKHDAKATFFVLGWVAERCPGLVRKIAEQGHEIGSHGCMHRMAAEMGDEAFRRDIRDSKALLESIARVEVQSYRAPSWSIAASNYRYLRILEEEGYAVDSSIQPFRTFLSGSRGAPDYPYHPVVEGRPLSLVEIPSTVLKRGPLRIPLFGGFYLRAVPAALLHAAMRREGVRRPLMIYTHPWELDPRPIESRAPMLVRLSLRYNLRSTWPKLSGLLRGRQFLPIRQWVREQQEIPVVRWPD